MATRKKKEVVKRRGTARALDSVMYPKRYTVEIDLNPDDPTKITMSRSCENMTAWELYGVLHVVLKEIERQMLIKPDEEPIQTGNTLA